MAVASSRSVQDFPFSVTRTRKVRSLPGSREFRLSDTGVSGSARATKPYCARALELLRRDAVGSRYSRDIIPLARCYGYAFSLVSDNDFDIARTSARATSPCHGGFYDVRRPFSPISPILLGDNRGIDVTSAFSNAIAAPIFFLGTIRT